MMPLAYGDNLLWRSRVQAPRTTKIGGKPVTSSGSAGPFMIAWPRKPTLAAPVKQPRLRGGMPRLNGRAVAARLYAVRIGDKATTGWDLHNSRT